MFPWALNPYASTYRAVAINYKGVVIAIIPRNNPNDQTLDLYINNVNFTFTSLITMATVPAGATTPILVVKSYFSGEYRIELDNQAVIDISTYNVFTNINVQPANSMFNTTGGFCGTWNCDTTDDFKLRDGTVVQDPYVFGTDWAIADVDMLWPPGFTCGANGPQFLGSMYLQAQLTPGNVFNPLSQSNEQITKASDCCYNKKIDPVADQDKFNDCVYDVLLALNASQNLAGSCDFGGFINSSSYSPTSSCSCSVHGTCVILPNNNTYCVCNSGYAGIDCTLTLCRCDVNFACFLGTCIAGIYLTMLYTSK